MKKIIALVCMITCIFGMSACGSEKAEETFDYGVSEEDIITYTEAMVFDMISLGSKLSSRKISMVSSQI